jgi:hypothetical protein
LSCLVACSLVEIDRRFRGTYIRVMIKASLKRLSICAVLHVATFENTVNSIIVILNSLQ